jgi:hypothetical protein
MQIYLYKHDNHNYHKMEIHVQCDTSPVTRQDGYIQGETQTSYTYLTIGISISNVVPNLCPKKSVAKSYSGYYWKSTNQVTFVFVHAWCYLISQYTITEIKCYKTYKKKYELPCIGQKKGVVL